MLNIKILKNNIYLIFLSVFSFSYTSNLSNEMKQASLKFVDAIKSKNLQQAQQMKLVLDKLYKECPLADRILCDCVWGAFPNCTSWAELFKMADVALPEVKHREFTENYTEKPIVIVVASYNNAKHYKANLDSIFKQNYSNFRVIYVDDCSSDNTGLLVEELVERSGFAPKFNIIKNDKRFLAMCNLYNAIHLCRPEEIVVLLDGDDCFYHDNVLNVINKEYSTKNIWLTHGSCCYLSSGAKLEWCMPIPCYYILENKFRQWPHGPTHIRSFYAWLFHKIDVNDFMDESGWFYKMSYDVAMFMPMLEMAGKHHSYIDEVLCVYNDLNDINDHKVDCSLQHDLNRLIRQKDAYEPLSKKFIL